MPTKKNRGLDSLKNRASGGEGDTDAFPMHTQPVYPNQAKVKVAGTKDKMPAMKWTSPGEMKTVNEQQRKVRQKQRGLVGRIKDALSSPETKRSKAMKTLDTEDETFT